MEVDIFKNQKKSWKFFGFFWNFVGDFLGGFFGRNFLGGIFGEDLFWQFFWEKFMFKLLKSANLWFCQDFGANAEEGRTII